VDEAALRLIAESMMMMFRKDAAVTADQRANKAKAEGDISGFYMWKRVVDAICDLQRKDQQDVTRV
jgi:hypothetical protein